MEDNGTMPGGFIGVDYDTIDRCCPDCIKPLVQRDCDCADGFSHHDCGEDCCCCLNPEPNVTCADCGGTGFKRWCPECGYVALPGGFTPGGSLREGMDAGTNSTSRERIAD